MSGQAWELVVAGILVVVAVLAGVRVWRHFYPPPAPPVPAFVIEEGWTSSISAVVCLLVLFASSVFCAIEFARSATVMQEILWVLIWIGNTLFWGGGAALGRRRRYAVYPVESAAPAGRDKPGPLG